MTDRRFALGIDIGQSRDPSAFAVCELTHDRALSGLISQPIAQVTHLERLPLGSPYPAVVQRIHDVARSLHFLDPVLVLDAGGVGRAVLDQLRADGLRVIGVTSTGGNAQTMAKRSRHGADWNVSKLLLLGGVAELVYSNRLRIAAGLAEAHQLLAELGDLESKVSAAGRETIQVSDQATDHHADLVSAVALACWALLDKPSPRVRTLDWRAVNPRLKEL